MRAEEAAGAKADGALLDVSAHGFRARHHCRELTSGQVVRFEHAFAAGRARVVWTRIAGQDVESGFLLLD